MISEGGVKTDPCCGYANNNDGWSLVTAPAMKESVSSREKIGQRYPADRITADQLLRLPSDHPAASHEVCPCPPP